MNILFIVFQSLAWVLNLYTLIIFMRVLITWVPSWSQNAFGRFLAGICDPYLNWFKRFKSFRTSTLDFTPVLAIGLLIMLASIFGRFVLMQRISVGISLAAIFSVLWSFVSSFITFVNIIIAVRLVFNLLNRATGSVFWQRVDAMISPLAYRITGMILPRKYIQYRTVLIISIVVLILIQVLGNWFFGFAERIFLGFPI